MWWLERVRAREALQPTRALLLVHLVVPEGSHGVGSGVRVRIYRLAQKQPGIRLSVLAENLSLPMSTLRHHVNALERERLVTTTRIRRRRCVFPGPMPAIAEIEDRAVLEEPAARAIVAAILDRPRQSMVEVLEVTGLSPRVAYYHAKRLLDAGFLTTSAVGKYRGIRPTPRLYAELARMDEHA